MSNISLIDGHIDNAEHCVSCGAVIPEGRQVCIICGLKSNYKLSTADVVEVVRKPIKNYEGYYEVDPLPINFCPFCGRNLRGDKNE